MSLEIMTDVDLNQNAVRNIPDNIETVSGKRMHALDAEMSSESENPVQNKAIKEALDALDTKIDGKTVNVDGSSVMKSTVNNSEVLYAVGYRNIVNNAEKGESFNVSFGGRVPPAGSLTATGLQSHAEGSHPTAEGDYSHAEGYYDTATGTASHAEGNTTVASGDYSHTEGHQVTAYGESSHAEGYGEHQYQPGMGTNVRSLFDIAGSANGRMSLAFGDYSHAEGSSSVALEEASHAEGKYSRAMGSFSHAEGFMSCTSKQTGNASHAEGIETDAYESASHAEGYRTRAVGYGSHAEGLGSSSNSIPSYYLSENMSGYGIAQMWVNSDINVAYSSACHTEGWGCVAIWEYSHAEGSNTLAYGSTSHSEGYGTDAYGNYSHIEGYSSNKFFPASLSDNEIISAFSQSASFSLAKGTASHVEGSCNIALGDNSHAEGKYNAVLNPHSHVEGVRNIVYGSESHAEGESNTINSGSNYSHAEGYDNTISGNGYSHAEGRQNAINGTHSHAEGYSNNITSADYAHAEGSNNTVSNSSAHAEGYKNTVSGLRAHAEGSNNLASGSSAHAEGFDTEATGDCAHAEGESTEASGDQSHAEGSTTYAQGNYSHAEGFTNYAEGQCSHVEGFDNHAYDPFCHTEGAGNEAHGECCHVEGSFNNITGDSAHGSGSHNKGTGKGGMFITGSLNTGIDNNSQYASLVAGQSNSIGELSYAIGTNLHAKNGSFVIGNYNRTHIAPTPGGNVLNNVIRFFTPQSGETFLPENVVYENKIIVKKDDQDNVVSLIMCLRGLESNITKNHITSVTVNTNLVNAQYYSVERSAGISQCIDLTTLQAGYLIIDAAGITIDPNDNYHVDVEYVSALNDSRIFQVGNGMYAEFEDCNNEHEANAFSVSYDGTARVQKDITFKYKEPGTGPMEGIHRISCQKIVQVLLNMGVNITDLEVLDDTP
jgi:hypothetical protein